MVEQLQISPGESKELTFNYDYSQIDYICKEHTMKDLIELTVFLYLFKSIVT